jgi:hypothetical protein
VASLPTTTKGERTNKKKTIAKEKISFEGDWQEFEEKWRQEEEDDRKPPAKSMLKKKSTSERNTQKENSNTMENNHNNQEEEQVEAPKQPTDTALAKNKTKNKP